jgi:Transmembrane amino acid transporter protein
MMHSSEHLDHSKILSYIKKFDLVRRSLDQFLVKMEKTDEEKKIDKWLPITSSRNAKWWYSAFHNVTAMVGAGVLTLPYAMSELGW